MKTMTCNQLGGACDMEFHAETFDEIAKKAKQHGSKMFENNDAAHIFAMEEIRKLMNDPEAMKAWMQKKQQIFEVLPDTT